eukprot:CAMPEP_0182421212 /NCGR_PEP_ID=MMETSP1167-20130531/6487_1 /TAXON_ID=2988 /ORGANISM="Mallomonas Sp, Strain CCMP3275" /LENGTH=326 /DNA_ID=CAMNT_0024598107 /DNA_START=225 /DNA_END=1205 /DNA_ORIENTATION=-
MLQDTVRTGTYQQAFFQNASDFKDKVVLDVGTGTGILAFFAVQAGAKKVYAVDAAQSIDIAKQISESNGFTDRIVFIHEKVEEMELPEKVDVIVSEPIGFLLVHERMLETYAIAREKFLKPGGLMMPTTGNIVIAPLTDETLYREQLAKIYFWQNTNFFGLDLTSAVERAYEEYFSQPVVGYFPAASLLSSERTVHSVDFSSVTAEELQNFEVLFSFRIEQTAIMHGLGCWFDIVFSGSTATVVLSTSPTSPGTHWYQCRLLLRHPIAVNRGQTVSGSLFFEANEKYSYFIHMKVALDNTDISSSNRINLHDQMYHYLNAPPHAEA